MAIVHALFQRTCSSRVRIGVAAVVKREGESIRLHELWEWTLPIFPKYSKTLGSRILTSTKPELSH
jgi:hypothetical protein